MAINLRSVYFDHPEYLKELEEELRSLKQTLPDYVDIALFLKETAGKTLMWALEGRGEDISPEDSLFWEDMAALILADWLSKEW